MRWSARNRFLIRRCLGRWGGPIGRVSVPLRLDLLECFAKGFGRTTRADEGEHQMCDQDRSDGGQSGRRQQRREEEAQCADGDAGCEEEGVLSAGTVWGCEHLNGPEAVEGLRAKTPQSTAKVSSAGRPAEHEKDQHQPTDDAESGADPVQEALRDAVGPCHETEEGCRHRAAPQQDLQEVLGNGAVESSAVVDAWHEDAGLPGAGPRVHRRRTRTTARRCSSDASRARASHDFRVRRLPDPPASGGWRVVSKSRTRGVLVVATTQRRHRRRGERRSAASRAVPVNPMRQPVRNRSPDPSTMPAERRRRVWPADLGAPVRRCRSTMPALRHRRRCR